MGDDKLTWGSAWGSVRKGVGETFDTLDANAEHLGKGARIVVQSTFGNKKDGTAADGVIEWTHGAEGSLRATGKAVGNAGGHVAPFAVPVVRVFSFVGLEALSSGKNGEIAFDQLEQLSAAIWGTEYKGDGPVGAENTFRAVIRASHANELSNKLGHNLAAHIPIADRNYVFFVEAGKEAAARIQTRTGKDECSTAEFKKELRSVIAEARASGKEIRWDFEDFIIVQTDQGPTLSQESFNRPTLKGKALSDDEIKILVPDFPDDAQKKENLSLVTRKTVDRALSFPPTTPVPAKDGKETPSPETPGWFAQHSTALKGSGVIAAIAGAVTGQWWIAAIGGAVAIAGFLNAPKSDSPSTRDVKTTTLPPVRSNSSNYQEPALGLAQTIGSMPTPSVPSIKGGTNVPHHSF